MSSPALRLDGLGGHFELAAGTKRPTIDRGRARISEEALNVLLAPGGARLRVAAGQADLEKEVAGLRITATITAVAAPSGRLRLEATKLRLGPLPVPPNLVSLALSQLQGRRGIYIEGSRAVELDLQELTRAAPIVLDIRLSNVRLEPGWLELHCVPRGAD